MYLSNKFIIKFDIELLTIIKYSNWIISQRPQQPTK